MAMIAEHRSKLDENLKKNMVWLSWYNGSGNDIFSELSVKFMNSLIIFLKRFSHEKFEIHPPNDVFAKLSRNMN